MSTATRHGKQTLYALFVVCGLLGCQEPSAATNSDAEVPTAGSAVTPLESSPEPAPVGQTETVQGSPPPALPVAPAGAAKQEVALEILNWEMTRSLVGKHPGKVVVMDLWSTFCPPCIAEFPHLVRLHNELGDRVACISVSLDYEGFDDMPVESYREKVVAFLNKQQSTLTNVLLSTSSEELFNQIEHKSMPVVYVFDKSGALAGQFPDPKDPAEFSYAQHVRPLVESLLADETSSGSTSAPAP